MSTCKDPWSSEPEAEKVCSGSASGPGLFCLSFLLKAFLGDPVSYRCLACVFEHLLAIYFPQESTVQVITAVHRGLSRAKHKFCALEVLSSRCSCFPHGFAFSFLRASLLSQPTGGSEQLTRSPRKSGSRQPQALLPLVLPGLTPAAFSNPLCSRGEKCTEKKQRASTDGRVSRSGR